MHTTIHKVTKYCHKSTTLFTTLKTLQNTCVQNLTAILPTLRQFLQSLTTSRAVLVILLSSDCNSFSAIFIIFLVFSVFYGRRAFLFKLKAQYKDLIRLLQIDIFSVLNAGNIFSK